VAPVGGAQLGQHPLATDFAGGMRLLGYDLSAASLPGDGAFDVALYVARTAASDQRYWPIFTVEDGAGLAWHDPEILPPRWQREPPATPLWPLDQYAQWARHLNLLPGTPPGTYKLWGQVFDLDSQQIASVLDAAGNAAAPRFALDTLAVARPSQPFRLTPPKSRFHDFGPIALLGYDLDHGAANAGDSLHLSLFWRSQIATGTDDTAVVSFVGPDSQPAFGVRVDPANGYPTSQWRPGDEWRGQSFVHLPAELPAGDYTVTVELNGAAPGLVPLTVVHVNAPARSFQRPAMAVTSGAQFSGVGVLEGYSLSRTTGSLIIDLVWRATASPASSYSAFVHLEGQAGRIWAQSDSAPANWSRPTTGWVTGEYVLDSHTLQLPPDLPAGTYTLWAGLYDPLSGARVSAVINGYNSTVISSRKGRNKLWLRCRPAGDPFGAARNTASPLPTRRPGAPVSHPRQTTPPRPPRRAVGPRGSVCRAFRPTNCLDHAWSTFFTKTSIVSSF
jgi:hypothetical protein